MISEKKTLKDLLEENIIEPDNEQIMEIPLGKSNQIHINQEKNLTRLL